MGPSPVFYYPANTRCFRTFLPVWTQQMLCLSLNCMILCYTLRVHLCQVEKNFLGRVNKEVVLRKVCWEISKKSCLESSLSERLKDFLNTPDTQPFSQPARIRLGSFQPAFQPFPVSANLLPAACIQAGSLVCIPVD